MSDSILFVDDDPNILEGFRRGLRKLYTVETALGGEQGLETLSAQGPFAVVVSDQRMPGMDGVQFLTRVRTQSPDSIRIMLTGQADLEDAIGAVNQGNIFRFLTKPCENDLLARTLDAALKQYHLVIAERELLEKTLKGSIKLLTDILSLVNPAAFSRADRMKRYMRHLCGALGLADPWQYELAALFSQIGWVTVPGDTLDRHAAGGRLSQDEEQMISALPSTAYELLANIPRLEPVAQIIRRQSEEWPPAETVPDDSILLGAQLLAAALRYDEAVNGRKQSHTEAVESLRSHPQRFPAYLVNALHHLIAEDKLLERHRVSILDLQTNMILDEDLKTKNGLLLVAKGQSVSTTMIKSVANYLTRGVIEEYIQVLISR